MTTHLSTSASRAIALSKKAVLIAIGATALSLLSLNASAYDRPAQRVVDFGDLDLSKSADTELLYRRLKTASQQVCGMWSRVSVQGAIRRKECATRALNNAVESVGHPSLTALHTAKTDVKLAQRAKGDTAKS